MGGYYQPFNEQTGIPELDDPGGVRRRRGLLAAMDQSDPSGPGSAVGAMPRAADSPKLVDRISDDMTRHPTGDTPRQTHSSLSGNLDKWLADRQSEYDRLSQPQPQQPVSTRSKILRGIALAAPTALGAALGGGAGAGVAAGGTLQGYRQDQQRHQAQQNLENAQRDQQKGRLLQDIGNVYRTREQEEAADRRSSLAEEMANQRAAAGRESQERLFGQQNQLEATREAQRQATLKQQMDEQDKRQQAQFGEQEKLERMRESGRQKSAAGGAAGQRSYQFQSSRIDKLAAPIEQRAERLSRLTDTLNANDPQADALVAPELLTVMAGGQGSGLRMNEAEISRVIGGRTEWESIKAKLGAYQADPNKGFALTPAQREQVSRLLSVVQQRVSSKSAILNEERQNLANSDDPMEHRQIVNRLQKRLSDVDVSGSQNSGGALKDKMDGASKQAKDPLGIL